MRIPNTAQQPHRDWLFGRNPGAIEDQEAAGQQALVASSQLPVDGSAECAKYGITIMGDSPNDPLFVDVQLPPGWTIKPTDHSMWSDLLDADGKKRAAIFYKAAFYDRKAHMHWER